MLRNTAALLGLAILGCAPDTTTPSGPQPSANSPAPITGLAGAAAFEIMAAVQGRSERGFEDELLRLEARIPGLGGMFIDGQGIPTIWVRDRSVDASAIVELRAAASGAQYVGEVKARLQAADIRIMRGQFAFSELVAVRRYLAAHLRVPGLVALDADETLNRVRVSVTDQQALARVNEVVATLGLPDGIVTAEPVGAIQALATLRGRFRPTSGGIQIRNAGGGKCSIGYNVSIYAYSDTGYVTASHCDASSMGSGATGGVQYQNSVTAADTVGRVSLNPAWNRTDTECLGYTLCTLADVLFVKSAPMSSWAKRVAKTSWVGINNALGSIDITSYWTGISIVPWTIVGQDVYKVGRTTGYTRGTLAGTCEDVVVGGAFVVLCADRVVNSAIGEGDSGAPVFYPPVAPYPFYAMGILFAGGPFDDYNDDDQTKRCRTACTYYFSNWNSIGYHLNRYLVP